MTRLRGPALARMSPVLVGRDDVLALALRRWRGAVDGAGHLLMISGEAGIGKTRMLSELVERIGDARLLTASAFPREAHSPGGMLLNLADDLARSGDEQRAAALRERIVADSDDAADAARRRRLLVGDLARILEPALVDRPTLLMAEDAHWADEVSLEVLARLVPVIGMSPCLVLVTLRSDESSHDSPLGPWRTRLLAQRQAEEVRLGRLGRGDVAAMAEAIQRAPLAAALVDVLLERSDGIPLHVEELLASGDEAVPETIAESVRTRAGRLPAEAREILLAASVIGRSFEADLLETVAHAEAGQVDRALRELADEHFVLEAPSGETYVFRHALLCDAVYRTIPLHRRRELHVAVATESIRRGLAEAMISDHFERAREFDDAHRHALAGARDAASRSAHREAAALFRRALRTAPASIEPLERARLAAGLAAELLAVDDAREASVHLSEAIATLRSLGRETDAATLVPDLMLARHLLGASLDERAELAHTALSRLDAALVPKVAGAAPRAALLAALAAAHMLDRRLEESAAFGGRAEATLETAEASARARKPVGAAFAALPGPEQLRIALDATLGVVLAFAGRGDEGWARLESAIRRAERARFEQEAARAHRMIGSSASVLLDYSRAERCLARGIEYTARVERWNDHHYLVAHSAHVRWAVGDWDAAEERARRAIATGAGITTRITALHVLGFLALGRGRWSDARQHLEQSRQLAESMGELQRLSPSLWGLAELALGQGDPVTAVALCERALAASRAVDDAAYLFPFAVTGTRAHLATAGPSAARSWIDRCAEPIRRRALPGTLTALVHAEGLLAAALGEHETARALLASAETGWASSGRWWEGAWALIDLAEAVLSAGRASEGPAATAAATAARSRAEAVGAEPLARAAAAVLGRLASTAPLSARELDVARLIAEGATNRAIAERLVIAPKTVSAHVEHILTKLGASRRTEIAAWVTRADAPGR